MDSTKLWVAIIGALITALGWLAGNELERRRSDRKRTIEAKTSYIQKQIEELYGPLFNLTMQIIVLNHIKYALLQSLHKNIPTQDTKAIEDLFANEYFIPLHKEMRSILKSKLFLVEEGRLPGTFYTYLRSAFQEQIQRELWARHQIDTHMIKDIPYPDAFTFEVQETLEKLLENYENLLRGIHPNIPEKNLQSTG